MATSFLRSQRRADSPHPSSDPQNPGADLRRPRLSLLRPPTSPVRTNSPNPTRERRYQPPPLPRRNRHRLARTAYEHNSEWDIALPMDIEALTRRPHSPDSSSSASFARSVPQCISVASTSSRNESSKSTKKLSRSLATVTDDCPICTDKLVSVFNEDIGATVPCGHCFHWKCYQECRRSWRGDICPTCKKPVSSFIRIYLTSNFNNNNEALSGLEEEALDSLRKSMAQNESLKQTNALLEEELQTIKRASEAEEQLLSTVPKFMKDIGDSIQRIGNGLNYIYICMKRGCIRAQSEDQNDRNRNNNTAFFSPLSESADYYNSIVSLGMDEAISAVDNSDHTWHDSDVSHEGDLITVNTM